MGNCLGWTRREMTDLAEDESDENDSVQLAGVTRVNPFIPARQVSSGRCPSPPQPF